MKSIQTIPRNRSRWSARVESNCNFKTHLCKKKTVLWCGTIPPGRCGKNKDSFWTNIRPIQVNKMIVCRFFLKITLILIQANDRKRWVLVSGYACVQIQNTPVLQLHVNTNWSISWSIRYCSLNEGVTCNSIISQFTLCFVSVALIWI